MLELKENDLYFSKVNPNAIIPTKEKENAGYDIYACFDKDFFVIPPHSTKLVPTGIASAISDKYYLGVAERGSTGKIGMKYSAGIIDSGYRGQIFIALSNINNVDIIISKLSKEELMDKYGEIYKHCDIYPYSKAICQAAILPVPKMEVKEISVDEIMNIKSERGTGSLGSSGK